MTVTSSRPIRVLFLSPTLMGGGAERLVSGLLQHLDRSRVTPLLCLMTGRVTYPVPADVPVFDLDKRRPTDIPLAIRRLRQLIRREKPDVVVGSIVYTSWVLGAAMLGMRNRPKWIARSAASPRLAHRGPAEMTMLPIMRWLLRNTDQWVTNSSALASEVTSFFRVRDTPVDVVYNPVDFDGIERQAADSPPPRDDLPVLIAVGRLEPQKRPDLLVEAFARVHHQRRAKLWICGTGSLSPQVQSQIESLGLQEDARLLGFQDNPYRYMRAADIFVLTSDFEGMPNSLIEAQGLGLPVVSTRCPTGPDEIIDHGRTGLLVPVGAADAIAEAILQLLDDPQGASSMGRAARELVRTRFDRERVTLDWEELFSKCMQLPGTGPAAG